MSERELIPTPEELPTLSKIRAAGFSLDGQRFVADVLVGEIAARDRAIRHEVAERAIKAACPVPVGEWPKPGQHLFCVLVDHVQGLCSCDEIEVAIREALKDILDK